ncbi:alanine racemase [Ruminococcus sp. CLA-AA-H200]|uniref:Alanine racemase n=1 Tax=Ruminococcus turbiniformis TaxID=2881258 RepID=A0ABS8FUA7_9FIRM|nr:alanine racemase [Ruminococcus turbiniformis]MCC2253562.1 alanine racemase [Ruminococcus turbiniformis]
MKQHNRVCAVIDLDAVRENMEQMKKRIGENARLIAVVKTDGYGHGAVPIARMFEETSYVWGFAVACMEEAAALREHGIRKPILVLGCVFPDQYEEMIDLEIRPAVYTEEMAEAISKEAQRKGKDVCFHIKIDTGMGRIGFPVSEESAETIERIGKLPRVCLEGMFTHFAKADETDKTYTLEQHRRFLWMKEQMEKRHVPIRYFDCDNSAGIIDFPDMKHDLARAGIATYGMYPSDEVNKEAVRLRPALTLVSHVSFVKDVEPGTSISYGGTFTAEKKMRVATIPVGYGDGYPRSLSNKGSVLIHGKRAKILGRVCMDQFMVDVTEIPETKFMDRVILVGEDGDDRISVEELSALSGRFNYEFVCCLGKRIPRMYMQDGRILEVDS